MAKRLGKDPTAKAGTKSKVNGPLPKEGEAAGSGGGPNTPARGDTLRRGFAKLWALDREIKTTVALEVTPLRADRSEVWKNLRNDLDAKAADLSPLYAVFKRDQEVREIDDMLDMQKSQDMLREAFDGLRQGETLNFLAVVGGGGDDKPATRSEARTDPDRSAELEENGRAAHGAGGTRGMCPWPEDSDSGKAWLRGFDAAVAKTAGEMDSATGTSEEDERRPGQPPRTKRGKGEPRAAA